MFCEKPAGVYTKQVEEMKAVANKSGKVFVSCTTKEQTFVSESQRDGSVRPIR